MTCGRIEELMDRFLETVKRALGERAETEHCVYVQDVRGYFYPRPNAPRVYACGAYATLFRSYRLLVAPGAVIAYNITMDDMYCKVLTDYDAVLRYIAKRPHYTICLYEEPVELSRALVCAG